MPKLTTVDITIPPPPDTEAPGVSISVPSGVQTGAFNATITFTELVSGFTQSDLSLSGTASVSVTGWSANSDNTIYTATITPTASGTVTIGVAANVATDAANNQNTAATSKTVTVDVDKPTVTIGVPSGTQTGAFDATITFSEAVSGFVGSDVSLTGSAASITSWSANSDDTVYTATITPTVSGTVTIGVAANVATDAAGNNNTAATSKTVTVSVDTNAPGVSIAVPSGVQNGAFNVTITFTEAVSGFVGSDVSLTGSASSITSWSANSANTVYTATITPTTSGTVTLGVAANVATDAANNQNTAATSKTVTVDVDKPTVTIGVPSGTQTGAFDATITFSEAVSGFTQSDISLTGSAASITSWSGNSNNTVYTATITPTASGTVTIGVAANVATDAANNPNTAATSQTVTITLPETTPDPATWMPDANLRAAVRSALGIASNANFSKDDLSTLTSLRAVQAQVTNLTGLEYATGLTTLVAWGNQISSLTPIQNLTSLIEIRIGNNQISDVTPLDDLTSLTKLGIQHNNISDVTPLAGLVNLTWLRLAGNPISDLSPLVTLVKVTDSDVDLPEPDTTAPGVSISVPSGLQNGAFNATITFTETVSGFVQSEVSLTGSASRITSWSANSNNTIYTATITPTASGTVTVGVAANVATDAANNSNTAATSQTVTVDVDKPGVSISVPSGVQNGVFNATITFTEAVLGFVQSDVSLTGSAASITSWSANTANTVYTATITPTASGTVTIGVAANVATDAANNSNTAATSQTVTVDVDKPGVSISVPSGVQNGVFNATITFTEAVSGFTQSEVSLTGSAASITAWRANSNNAVYTATITPTASGTVIVGIAAGVATDAASNQNTTATSQTVNVDLDAPSVSITVPTDDQIGAFDTTITFTETVSGFVQSDVTISGTANATITAWNTTDNITYTATITPTTTGTVTLSVAAGVATDSADNLNTASATQTVTAFVTQQQIIDTDPPGVSIEVPEPPQNGVFEATITFTEAVSGFEQSDVSLSGSAASITSWSANSDDTVYTATITPTASGTVTVSVAASVATDAANNPNTAATSQTVNIDVDSPSVSITVPSDVQGSAFEATITFSEAVSGFEQTDVSLTGTATASITAWVASSDNTTYTATITPTTSGTVTLNVAAGVASDAANNANTAAMSQTVNIDVDMPGVSISIPSGDQTGTFSVSITFTEVVSGFEQTDVSLTGTATASITAWSEITDNTVYIATITPTTTGTVILNIAASVATDAANNANTASATQTVNVDVGPPGVTITVPEGVQDGKVNAIITFTEVVSDFDEGDISLEGTAVSNIYGFGLDIMNADLINLRFSVYRVKIIARTTGTVLIQVPAGVATDADGNPNTASEKLTVIVYPNWDVNEDGVVDDTDVALVTAALGQSGEDIVNPRTDVNRDGTVDAADTKIVRHYHKDTARLIPDANLAAVIRDELGLSEHTAITETDMQSLNRLRVNWKGVTDLTGLEHATNLRSLDLGSNSISNFTSLAGLTNLRLLDLESNSISNLTSLAGLTNLRSLVLWNNSISNLTPLTGLTNLKSLHLGLNSISDLTSLAGLTNLRRLKLGNNSISDLTSLAGLTNLTSLNLGNNSISDLTSLAGLTNLTFLYLENNSISDLTSLTGLTELQDLWLQNNQISNISPLTGLTSLTYLYLEDNSILDTSPIYPLTQGNLADLDIHVYPAWDVNEDGVVDATDSALVTAALGQAGEGIVNPRTDVNRDGTVNATDQQLVTDNLDQIVAVPDANLAAQIRHKLGLSATASISARVMLDLEELEASSASISNLTGLEHATNLQKLTLGSNNISDISAIATLTNLTRLELGRNSINDISALGNLTKLTTLHLHSNDISDIGALGNLTKLLDLYLSFNDISDISALGNLTRLLDLYLSNNSISTLNSIAGLPRLAKLYLSTNLISDLSPLAQVTTLKSVTLSGNPIVDTSPLYPLLEANGGKLRTVDIDISQYPPWDVNEDGVVDATDSALVTAALGQSGTDIVNSRTDINGDGTVDNDDLTLVTDNLDSNNLAPSSNSLLTLLDPATLETLDPETLAAHLEILRVESDGSLKYLWAIELLESLLAAIRPDETRLLANYPNPFNPETWIPYQLANDTDVRISIYDINGALVRQLDLGYQQAGYYTTRSRAVYWDGRNEFGEQIANGIYFYHLQADNMSLLRKMVILK